MLTAMPASPGSLFAASEFYTTRAVRGRDSFGYDPETSSSDSETFSPNSLSPVYSSAAFRRAATFPPPHAPFLTFPKPSSLKNCQSEPVLFAIGDDESPLKTFSSDDENPDEALNLNDLEQKLNEAVTAPGTEVEFTSHTRTTVPVLTSLSLSIPSSPESEGYTGALKRVRSDIRHDRRRLARKKVVFADDHGQELVSVRTLQEPSDVPPVLNSPVVLDLLKVHFPEDHGHLSSKTPEVIWDMAFAQPASNYISFREKIDKHCVALENVILRCQSSGSAGPHSSTTLRDTTATMLGTIKVKNLDFSKQVFLRITENNWIDYRDYDAQYKPYCNPCNASVDTFCFELQIPNTDTFTKRLEFCVCYKTKGQEFWDNGDGGKNFALVSKKVSQEQQGSVGPTRRGSLDAPNGNVQLRLWPTPDCGPDAYKMGMQNWSSFAAWESLISSNPYWYIN